VYVGLHYEYVQVIGKQKREKVSKGW